MSVSIGQTSLIVLLQEVFLTPLCILEHMLSLGAAKAARQHPAVLCLKQFCIELAEKGMGG